MMKSILTEFLNLILPKFFDHIKSGKLQVEEESIDVKDWFNSHLHGVINEEHISVVDITKPILQAEIRPGMFVIIDGNHRIEKAYRNNIMYINSFKLKGEQLVDYFIDVTGYKAFVEYWNSKLEI